MGFIKINYQDTIDDDFYYDENDEMYEDEEEEIETEYYEDIEIPDNYTWSNFIESEMSNQRISLWNANDLFEDPYQSDEEKGEYIDPEEYGFDELDIKGTSVEIINRFLDLKKPQMNKKMIECLKLNDFLKIFINTITRVPDSVLYNQEDENQGFSIDESIFRERDISDITLVKRSYNAVQVLCSDVLSTFVNENSKIIGKELIKIFHPKSEGNFHHFKYLWNYLIDITNDEIALILTSEEEYKEPPVFQMLRYIHENSIASSLIATIFPLNPLTTLQMEIFTKLQEIEFVETILAMLDMKDFQKTMSAASEFLIQIIEEGSKTEDSDILLFTIQMDPSCLSNIIKHVSESSCVVQQDACTELLLAFLEKCIYTSDNVSNTSSSFVFSEKTPLKQLKQSIIRYLI